ncbi:hypothetical protein ACFQWB_09765 [Paenibacillus thermoaerophilus]|uniref:LexA-binding, inner membrane-associated hydrolase n=1 Tax=Paenibacillus thermoaerophilus TaxID=1215385 RepID=A0ABW2V4P5_9BACL|nr:hypothetical protein [Paenibacillus thermoaerophilus]TMV11132.1 hypothetical protein FE781_12695 [Paenibacillus thermoaerophilus]
MRISVSDPNPALAPAEKPAPALLRWVSADAVWVSVMASVALYFLDTQWANTVLFGYLLVLAPRHKTFWPALATLAIFTILGFHAAHRFDWDKANDWLIGHVVPVFAVMALVRLNQQDAVFRKVRAAWTAINRKARLHWIPGSILTGTLVSLLVRDHFWIYGGLIVILGMLTAFPNNRQKWRSGLLMITVHVLLIHLFLDHGLVHIKLDPVTYISSNWGTVVSPYLAMLAMLYGTAKRNPIS